MPTISIIIPIYNTTQLLQECLASIHLQTFADFECICINDDSNHDNETLLNQYTRQDSRFHLIHQSHPNNSAACNMGLENATGDYVVFLNSNTIYHPQYLEISYCYITKYHADISICTHIVIPDTSSYGFGVHYQVNHLIRPKVIHRPLVLQYFWQKSYNNRVEDKLYAHKLIQTLRFDTNLSSCKDIPFHLEAIYKAHKMVVIPYTLMAHHDSPIFSAISPAKIKEFAQVAKNIYYFATLHSIPWIIDHMLKCQASKYIFISLILEPYHFGVNFAQATEVYAGIKQQLLVLMLPQHANGKDCIIKLGHLHLIDHLATKNFLAGNFIRMEYLLARHKHNFTGAISYFWRRLWKKL